MEESKGRCSFVLLCSNGRVEQRHTMKKKTLKKMQYGLQMSANRRVARELAHLGFHQQKEYNQILQQLNDKTINEYYKKY